MKTRFAVAIAVLTLVAASCGTGDEGTGDDTQVIDITLSSYEISPASATMTSGEPVVVNVENLSARTHTWTLLAAGTQWASTDDMDPEQILVTTSELGLNGTETLQFTAPEPGTYQVVCTVHGHIRLGMVAELVVES